MSKCRGQRTCQTERPLFPRLGILGVIVVEVKHNLFLERASQLTLQCLSSSNTNATSRVLSV